MVRLSPHRLTAPGLGQDLHYAVRVLRRNPGYALTAMICLALGIGVNSMVFSMVNELFWQPLPLPHPSRVAIVGRASDGMTCSYRDYLEFRRRAVEPGSQLFTGLVAFEDTQVSIDTGGLSQIIGANAVTANFADMLELPAQLGRWLSPEDDRVGSDPVVVIGDGAWTRMFGRSPDAIGQRVRIGTERYRVIGVAPAGFVGMSAPHTVELWIPLASQPSVRDLLTNAGEWERPLVRLIGRLADDRSARAAEAGMRTLDAQIRRDFPRENAPAGALTVAVAAGASMPEVRQVATPMAALLLSVTAVVLLIACVNVSEPDPFALGGAAARDGGATRVGRWTMAAGAADTGRRCGAGGRRRGAGTGGGLLERTAAGLQPAVASAWRDAHATDGSGLASGSIYSGGGPGERGAVHAGSGDRYCAR
jgi:hypothetical protein